MALHNDVSPTYMSRYKHSQATYPLIDVLYTNIHFFQYGRYVLRFTRGPRPISMLATLVTLRLIQNTAGPNTRATAVNRKSINTNECTAGLMHIHVVSGCRAYVARERDLVARPAAG